MLVYYVMMMERKGGSQLRGQCSTSQNTRLDRCCFFIPGSDHFSNQQEGKKRSSINLEICSEKKKKKEVHFYSIMYVMMQLNDVTSCRILKPFFHFINS